VGLEVINLLETVYEIRSGSGVGVFAQSKEFAGVRL
jgi:hypothetical protein